MAAAIDWSAAGACAAGAGAKVVKHGNRAASSACGAADVLEELGIPLDLTGPQVAEVGERVGITFCFAAAFHPALRNAAVPRRELGVPTTFNLLGPLANPGDPSAQAVGVADGRVAGLMAGVLARRGIDALVFHGDDGLDEVPVDGVTVHGVALRAAAHGTPLRDPALDHPGEVEPLPHGHEARPGGEQVGEEPAGDLRPGLRQRRSQLRVVAQRRRRQGDAAQRGHERGAQRDDGV